MTKNELLFELEDGATVAVTDDPFSDRIRCDHPHTLAAPDLADTLHQLAEHTGRGRLMVLTEPELGHALLEEGFECEAILPDFYHGTHDCMVLGAWPDARRAELASPAHVEQVLEVLATAPDATPRPPVVTERATRRDAPQIAALIGATFPQYPTPSSDPGYIARDIASGTPYRVVRDHGEVVACASADLITEAATAELTDCATRPTHRGRGFMQALLSALMDDLRALSYPSAFTLARANQVGMNLAFQRLGFTLHGTMSQSCRIGRGIEDMNVWSRAL